MVTLSNINNLQPKFQSDTSTSSFSIFTCSDSPQG